MKIEDMFLQEISTFKPGLRNTDPGNIIFNPDEVVKTNHPLTRLFRLIMSKLQVTHEQFNTAHNNYSIQSGFLPSTIDYNRNNIKKSMKKNKITYRIFEHVLGVILGYNILDLVTQINDPKTGLTKTYKLSDTVSELSPLSREITLDGNTDDEDDDEIDNKISYNTNIDIRPLPIIEEDE